MTWIGFNLELGPVSQIWDVFIVVEFISCSADPLMVNTIIVFVCSSFFSFSREYLDVIRLYDSLLSLLCVLHCDPLVLAIDD